MPIPTEPNRAAVIIGGGPAGLMAAEQLSQAGIEVDIFDAMPTLGRKFLRAGIGGLNLTHSEAWSEFLQRYGEQSEILAPCLNEFTAKDLRSWAAVLGVETFVGSSGRVFPVEKKAAPLLRRWLQRLRSNGVRIHTRHRWLGWTDSGGLLIQGTEALLEINPRVCVFALGGGSWSALGSDGHWLKHFAQRGIACEPLRPSNCGFEYPWSAAFINEQAGAPIKSIALSVIDNSDKVWCQRGDATISKHGLEGGPVYAVAAPIRDQIDKQGQCTVYWDLDPDRSEAQLHAAIAKRRVKDSLANVLRKQCGLSGSKLALFKALTTREQMADLDGLPKLIKNLPQVLCATRAIDEAISTAGGICFSALDESLMIGTMPGTYCVGEMLDWEAPTGGYLLTACFASGRLAGRAALARLQAD
jgi:uncharacterized flavoprotein (TIGR03862 family)